MALMRELIMELLKETATGDYLRWREPNEDEIDDIGNATGQAISKSYEKWKRRPPASASEIRKLLEDEKRRMCSMFIIE
ncbi:hypothetical protein [Citromicrobium bathyomarinum]|uniref:hypothetical protein n=1 Tax=Citromicrobium bathyomarinum TaxID=72174 RepID=UPI001E56E050|nr:hypothetical protein [Citromicrobium bathyomarinum]MCD1624025.1 hypothetical protein [Citromicrobium bathyomarinum]